MNIAVSIVPRTHGITKERLLEVLVYDPASGTFRWKHRPERSATWNGKYAGKIAGGVYKNGYRYICIDFVDYKAARLAWVMMTGDELPQCIDHINGNKADDRWENIRKATKSQNGANRPKQKNNTSGFKGVFWNKQRQKWQAIICKEKKLRHLGFFSDPHEASAAYERGAKAAFGEFAHQPGIWTQDGTFIIVDPDVGAVSAPNREAAETEVRRRKGRAS